MLADLLRGEVAAMNTDNFVVRPHRRAVERFSKADAWGSLSPEAFVELSERVAGLPPQLEAEGEEAKRFDLLLLNLQLAILRAEPAIERLCEQVRGIAGLPKGFATGFRECSEAATGHMPEMDADAQGYTLSPLRGCQGSGMSHSGTLGFSSRSRSLNVVARKASSID